MSSPIITVENVHKCYQRAAQAVSVLRGVDLTIERGAYVSLMGPSGSGKSTLLNLVAGLDRPTSGNVWSADHHISVMPESELTRWRASHVGFIFQSHHLIPVLTAYENVEIPLLPFQLPASRRRRQVLDLLELVGIADRAKHRPGQLSGGEQQRVGIARALVTDPDLLVADEPTGELDSHTSSEILRLLDAVHCGLGKTILLVTHDAAAASRAERTIRLHNGQLVEDSESSVHRHRSAVSAAFHQADQLN